MKRNQIIPLDLSLLDSVRVNTGAVEKRCMELPGRRTVKKEWQCAWLLKAVTVMDLTSLSGDDTACRVQRLCAKALQPVSRDILQKLSGASPIRTAAVCVYHHMIPAALKGVKNLIPVAAVSTGFPAGLTPFELKKQEIIKSIKAGATEIDIVISRHYIFEQNWQALYDEICAYRDLCKHAHLKVILATGDLKTLNNIAKASWVIMMAGADFIKTSTGKEAVNATLPVCLVMTRTIRDYKLMTGFDVGFKAAGGISNTKQALNIMYLIKEELGSRWLNPDLFRFGASSLLADIERQLFHIAYGHYSSRNYHSLH